MGLHRRQLLTGAAALSAASTLPAWAQHGAAGREVLSGEDIKLTIGHAEITVDGRKGHAVAINGMVPGPLIRLKEGQNFRCSVTNALDEDTSIHWHGLLLPFEMDGVPGVSFPGIKPGETFTYEFPIRQSGTYWYHSHSGLQELVGHYAPMVIDPKEADPLAYDREHVIVLSDYSFMHPHTIMQRLKQQPGYFNRQKQTVAGLLSGKDQPLAERVAWAAMRMDPTDISDVTGSTYTYLINGHGPTENWTGLFRPGERVRLRLINAAAMTIFNLRIPGLRMTVVQADGADVQPVDVDELQIANAETYDVIVQPAADGPYAIFAQAIDGSGAAVGTLATREGLRADAPPLRERPLLTMRDMGMGDMAGMDHSAHAGHATSSPAVKATPGNQMVSPMPVDRVADRGTGLEDAAGKVLTYVDLKPLKPEPDRAEPTRSMDVHLTGNMERFMWSFDGVKYADRPDHFPFRHGERVRVNLINDTMMNHPIHLHGHFFEVVTGDGPGPLKHTVNVMPGAKLSFDFTASELGDWAFHCHMLLHMHAGMFNVVTVRHIVEDAG